MTAEQAIEHLVMAYESGNRTGIVSSEQGAFHFPLLFCKIPKKYYDRIDMRGICAGIGLDFGWCVGNPEHRMPAHEPYVFTMSDGRQCKVTGFSERDGKFYIHRLKVEVLQ